jgi:hypothetical protein
MTSSRSFDGLNYSHTLDDSPLSSLSLLKDGLTNGLSNGLTDGLTIHHEKCPDQKELKRIRNRIASRKCRERKELKILNLQNRIIQLIVENEMLKSRLNQIF